MIVRAIVHLVIDDRGQDLVEYALLSGIVSVGSILLFSSIKDGMGAAYTSWTSRTSPSGVQTVWQPCAPAGGVWPPP